MLIETCVTSRWSSIKRLVYWPHGACFEYCESMTILIAMCIAILRDIKR